jgi:predicted DNA-binding protein (UPF0251 family)
MARRKKKRWVQKKPVATFYMPKGIAPHEMTGVTLPLEGLEALRLVDAEGMSRDDAAKMMRISTPTFWRVLTEARNIVSRALANGWAMHIEGGDYSLVNAESKDPAS